MISRQGFLKQAMGTAVLASAAGAYYSSRSSGAAWASSTSGQAYSLVFPKNSYTTKTKTVSTSSGTKTVTYRYYHAIPYVAHPVDVTYQSMDVSVPVKINGAAIDARNAPILFDITVGGYMSASVSRSGMPGQGAPGGGTPPSGATGGMPGGMPGGQAGAPSGAGDNGSNSDLALGAGYVVVTPGARGRDNVTSSGKYYGKAPAAIVDLKAAVRYLRANHGVVPGNTNWIISTGASAGGALSALLGASGDSPLYDAYLAQLGAANSSDRIFASAAYSPITDLEHADMAYEWMLGSTALRSGGTKVNQTLSKELAAAFAAYQAALNLQGLNGFGTITASSYTDYLLRTYLEPAATKYLSALSQSARASYLAQRPWISWTNGKATFAFAKFLAYDGRLKSLPAFDSFKLDAAENSEFGDATTNARHFTTFSLRYATGNNNVQIASDLPAKIHMMNPMYFVGKQNPNAARVRHWFLRTGSLDTDTSLTVLGNLVASVQNLGDDVNAWMYWDGGHAVNEDAPSFIKWVGSVTGYAG